MTQINIIVDEELDKILEELAEHEGKSKSKLVKEYFILGIREKIMPKLLDLYAQGKISLKKFIKLSPIPPPEVFSLIAKNKIEPPISPDLDDYTSNVAAKAIDKMKHEEK
ncbi:MAG TPA: ribbon-helix-helix protein, CopG family [Candidatus Deferrimicrobium sp.]|nr:ribbon-helix-helix protein, CopG family [Candidatus Deferrimicrobium sp.]